MFFLLFTCRVLVEKLLKSSQNAVLIKYNVWELEEAGGDVWICGRGREHLLKNRHMQELVYKEKRKRKQEVQKICGELGRHNPFGR